MVLTMCAYNSLFIVSRAWKIWNWMGFLEIATRFVKLKEWKFRDRLTRHAAAHGEAILVRQGLRSTNTRTVIIVCEGRPKLKACDG